MSNPHQETVDTYNRSAKQLAEYFSGIGSRIKYIDMAFKAAGSPKQARVVEIGCGDGRDAAAIVPRCAFYEGFDISEELIKLARERLPDANFVVADALDYEFPQNLDVVFAFASLLHLDKNDVADTLHRVRTALRPGGCLYISVKYATEYSSKVEKDEFGSRLFYYYNEQLLTDLAGPGFEVAESFHEIPRHTDWLEMIFRKKREKA